MKRTIDDIKKSIGQKASDIHRFMNSPLGHKVIRILEAEFQPGVGKDPYDTYFKLGQQDVLVYLKQLQRLHERGDLDHE